MSSDEDPFPPRTRQERANALFDELSEILRDAQTPGVDTQKALADADAAFDRLHAWISRGGVLPTPWGRHTCQGSQKVR
ncbi:hypothetical protein ACWFMI_14685 [Nocardiopsis terrae]